ncbi:MAG: fatty acid desaturase family protein [Bacteroidota bacterium]
MKKNDWLAIREISLHWAWIFLSLLLVWLWYHPLTILLSLFIIGGKQLACAILMHDAGHHAVFKNKKINDWVGQALGAWPIFQDMKRYRPYHLRHHQATGTTEDPDLLLTRGYPTSKISMFRKITRDLTGITGVKAFVGVIMMHLGYLEYNLGGQLVRTQPEEQNAKALFRCFLRQLGGPILVNLILFLIVATIFAPWVYLIWILAYFTTFQFCLRIRSIAEHSIVEDQTNPFQNTRTTYANAIEQLLFAPYHVNYHVEHHMMMSVPFYNLPKLHRLLKQRGFYNEGLMEKNYWEVMKLTVKGFPTPKDV